MGRKPAPACCAGVCSEVEKCPWGCIPFCGAFGTVFSDGPTVRAGGGIAGRFAGFHRAETLGYTVHVTRLFTILLLVLPGLVGAGVGVRGERGDAHVCGDSVCLRCSDSVALCCETPAGTAGVSHDGFCRCSCAPVPDRPRRPEAPLPQSDRDQPVPLHDGPAGVVSVVVPDREPPRRIALCSGVLSGLNNNGVRAFLGVWRT